MGAIYKRGQVYWIKYYRSGKAYYESSRSGNPADARALLRQREGDIEKGLPVTPAIGKVTVDEILNDLVADYETNGRATVSDLKRYVTRLTDREAFGGRRAANVTAAEIRAYILRRQEAGAANASINRDLSALRRAYTLAIQAGRLAARPYVPRLREDNARTGFFEEAQFLSVRRHLPPYADAAARFMYHTGWRKSLVLSLRWADVTPEGVRVPGVRVKNKQHLLFPWTAELREILDAQLALTKALEKERGAIIPFVFHRDGAQIRDFRRAWKTACRKAGIPGALRHDFRRTAARNLVRLGIPERVVMDLVGWKTRHMLDRYNIVAATDRAEAAAKIDRARSA